MFLLLMAHVPPHCTPPRHHWATIVPPLDHHARLCLAAILERMKLKRWLGSVLFLIVATVSNAAGAFVGVNIGTDVTDLPSASNVVAILKSHQITHVRLYNANGHMLQALSNTGIEVIVGVTDEEILGIGESASVAAAWISKNVAAYMPSTNITAISVGSEVLTSVPNVAPVLVPAMNHLHTALVASNLNFRVKVSTPQSMDVISRPFPPSTATFNSSWNSTIYQLLQFLKNTNSSYMLNAYPYYGYTKGDGIFPIEYALFRPLSPVKQIVDPNTLFHYNSMFEAMVDATYYAIEAFNFNNIPIVVTETGWPSFGGANEPDATTKNSETYNNNLIKRVINGSGPPSQPKIAINTYLYELFNEDKRKGPISERNWGVFYANGSSVYSLSFSASNMSNANSQGSFCVAKDDADTDKLQAGLSWACGQGQANCIAIQPGRPCYSPNNVKNHASYAYNDYYQKMHNAGGTCDFDGTATTTTEDPSYGSCIYAGSANTRNGGRSSSSTALGLGPVSPVGAGLNLQVSTLQYLISFISVFFSLLLS
ncbi:Glucan endo-1,3-beta-glucosidase 4 [Glycine soja]